MLSFADADRLLRSWDRQQAAYIAHRESRFTVMLEVLRLHHGDRPLHVVDLACGPGALSRRVLDAFPDATVTAFDHDPVLLAIAAAALAGSGDRFRAVDADLADPSWAEGLSGVDAVLSSTALHWFPPAELVGLYRAAAGVLSPGGLLMNADHLRFGSPALRAVAARHDEETQRAGFAAGAADYAGWHAEAYRVPALAPLVAERQRRFANRPTQEEIPLEFHVAALRAAGFAEAGTVWQYLDDYVVLGRR